MRWTTAGAAALALLVAACGTQNSDRVTGGAAAGAATGAGVGALGGPVGAGAGALIGGGAGAIAGAATEPGDLNLGRPPWSNPEVRTPVDGSRPSRSSGRARPAAEQDRAYMGGGMVGSGTGSSSP